MAALTFPSLRPLRVGWRCVRMDQYCLQSQQGRRMAFTRVRGARGAIQGRCRRSSSEGLQGQLAEGTRRNTQADNPGAAFSSFHLPYSLLDGVAGRNPTRRYGCNGCITRKPEV